MNTCTLITKVGVAWCLMCFARDVVCNVTSDAVTTTPFTIRPSQTVSKANTVTPTAKEKPSVNRKKLCPDKLSVCWKYNPPYINGNFSGIFPEFLAHMINTCCQNTTSLEYQIQVKDENGLQGCVKNESTDFVLPLSISRVQPFQVVIKFIESPGMTLVLNKKAIEATAQKTVWKTLTEAWPLLVLTVLLAAIAGILIWALDSAWNSRQFPVAFSRGALEGFWWAFVTMTTVGYGDRSPKFVLGRLFAVGWMLVGLAIISLMTATITTTLTTENIDKYSTVLNKKIGVIEKSKAEIEAMKMGATQTEAYKTVEELYQALKNEAVHGILLDLFVASYAQNNIIKNDENLFMAKLFEYSFWNVVAARKPFPAHTNIEHQQESDTFECFKVALQSKANDVYVVVQKYIRGRSLEQFKEGRDSTLQLNMFSSQTIVFKTGLVALSGILGVLIILGLLWEIVYHTSIKKNTHRYAFDSNFDNRTGSMTVSAWDINRVMHKLNKVDETIASLKEIKDVYQQWRTDMEKSFKSQTNGSVKTFENQAYTT